MTPEKLREARKKLGVTQKEMAKRLKTPIRTYQSWEYGKSRLSGVIGVAVRAVLKKKEKACD